MVDKGFFGENKNIEFKREIPKKHEKFLKDVIAFSNCTGGKIILGIEDVTNAVYGIGDANPFKLSDDISNMISDACTPQISPDITIQTLEDKTVLVIDVAPGRFRPYYLKTIGKEASSFIRINGTSRPADTRTLQELEMEGQRIYYDSMQEIGMEHDEEKALKLCETMKKIAVSSCKTEDEKADIYDMTIPKLEDMGLLCRIGRDYTPTHAFNLMTENRMKHAKIQCALFKGTERDEFIDRKEFKGPIYQQIDDAYQFVLRHINKSAEINGIVRRDIYELPIRAVREAIVNAVTHRSYVDDSCIQVSIYDDRVEILSPGMLYGGLDMEEALKGKSKCRNAAISEAFYYMGIIEGWGTGLERIQKSCREYGLKKPIIEEFGNGFRVVLFRKTVNESQDMRKKFETAGIGAGTDDTKTGTDGTETGTNDTKVGTNGTQNGINRRNQAELSEDELLIINILKNKPLTTQSQLKEFTGIPLRTVKRMMSGLQKKGIITRIGSNRSGRWEIRK